MYSEQSIQKIADLQELNSQQERTILEKDKRIIELEKRMMMLEQQQELEIKAKGLKHNPLNGLWEDKDGTKFCTKCKHKDKQLVPVGRSNSQEEEEWECKVCGESYESIDAKTRRIQAIKRAQDRYR